MGWVNAQLSDQNGLFQLQIHYTTIYKCDGNHCNIKLTGSALSKLAIRMLDQAAFELKCNILDQLALISLCRLRGSNSTECLTKSLSQNIQVNFDIEMRCTDLGVFGLCQCNFFFYNRGYQSLGPESMLAKAACNVKIWELSGNWKNICTHVSEFLLHKSHYNENWLHNEKQ